MGVLILSVMATHASWWAPCFVPAQGSIKKEQRKSPAEYGSGKRAGCNLKALIKSVPSHILSTRLGAVAHSLLMPWSTLKSCVTSQKQLNWPV